MKKILVLAGPTASGKTALAISLAKRFNGEVVNCDSMQIYKYMDIGSAKPTKEEQSQAIHHLIDYVDPRENFSVANYSNDAENIIYNIHSRNKLPIVSGGTGLYLNSILFNMDFEKKDSSENMRESIVNEINERGKENIYQIIKDHSPKLAESFHPNNIQRLARAYERVLNSKEQLKEFTALKEFKDKYQYHLFAITKDREELYKDINKRVDVFLKNGLVSEVENLITMGLTKDNISMKGIGYKEIISYLAGEIPLEEAERLIKRNSRRLAKRQLTWFKRYNDIKWLNMSVLTQEEAIKIIGEDLNNGSEETY